METLYYTTLIDTYRQIPAGLKNTCTTGAPAYVCLGESSTLAAVPWCCVIKTSSYQTFNRNLPTNSCRSKNTCTTETLSTVCIKPLIDTYRLIPSGPKNTCTTGAPVSVCLVESSTYEAVPWCCPSFYEMPLEPPLRCPQCLSSGKDTCKVLEHLEIALVVGVDIFERL